MISMPTASRLSFKPVPDPLPDTSVIERDIAILEPLVTEAKKARMAAVLSRRTQHIRVVLEDIYQTHNASAAMRSCECLGVQHLHVIEQTQTTARRVLKSSCQSDAERIGLLYQWILGRRPTASELSRASEYLQRSERLTGNTAAKSASETPQTQDDPNRGQPSSQAVWAGLVQALFASAEFRYIY